MSTITVTFSKPGATTVRVRSSNIGDTEQWRFYNTIARLPAAGTWTARASAGKDSGCFRFTVG